MSGERKRTFRKVRIGWIVLAAAILALFMVSNGSADYRPVHEMVHLLERRHTDRFTSFMNRFMPQWRYYRQELNSAPLGHVNWAY